MANVSVLNLRGGVTAHIASAAVTTGAAQQTVPCGKSTRLALRVANGGAAGIIVRILAGTGPRAALGPLDVPVAAAETAYIPLADTARFLTADTTVGVALLDAGGDTPDVGALDAVRIEAVQM